MAGCEQPVKTVYVTTAEAPEERVMNDFTVKPVEEYPAYYVGPGGQVMGIPETVETAADLAAVTVTAEGVPFYKKAEDSDEAILTNGDVKMIPKSFFIINGDIYFSLSWTFPASEEGEEPETITKYCKQTGGSVSYLTKASFPAEPEPERVTGTDGDHVFSIGDYKGTAYSSAKRADDPEERIIFIDGYCPVSGGMLIHVKENPHPSRPPGLLFWPDGKNSMTAWKGCGRFWMM